MFRKKSFDSLTGLKGLFCLVILFFHTLPSTALIDRIPLTSFIRSYGGTLGNYFFFIVSGFLITVGYRDRIGTKEISFQNFILKRLRKLYPLYIITNLISLIINIAQYGPSAINLKMIVFTVLLQNGAGLETVHPYNGPSWFLSALFVCYVAFYFVAYHAKNVTQYRCLIAFGIVWGYSILSGRWTVPLAFAHQGDSFFAFFTGCALAEIYPLIQQKHHRWLRPASVLILLGSGYLMLRYGVEIISGDSRVAFAFVICPLVVYLGISSKICSTLLQSRPVAYLGKISFSIYLWHFVLYDFFRYIYPFFSRGAGIEEPQYVLYLALVFLVSILSHRFIESR